LARALVLLAIGMAAGAAAAWLVVVDGERGSDSPAAQALSGAESEAASRAESAPAAATSADGFASERLAAYEHAMSVDSAAQIESLILETARTLPSPRPRMRLEALLARYAEIDVARATRFAQSLAFDANLLAPLYRIWAETDSDAAFGGLSSLRPRAEQRQVALAVLDVIGNDADGIERVAASLPDADRLSFEIDALLARAEDDPMAALEETFALDRLSVQRLVQLRLAETVARLDPQASLAQAGRIENPSTRTAFIANVLGAWARIDADAVFDYIAGPGRGRFTEQDMAYVVSILGAADPKRLQESLDLFSPVNRRNAERRIIQSMARTDVGAALERLASLPSGPDSDSMRRSIAGEFGRQDPEGALAWARTLAPPDEQVFEDVVRGIARTDIDRALDVIIDEVQDPTSVFRDTMPSPASLLLSALSGSPDAFPRVADRLLSLDDGSPASPFASGGLTMVALWSSRDPETALNWSLENIDRFNPSYLPTLFGQIAQNSPELAMQSLGRVPPEQREGFIRGIASGLAQNDLERGLSFLEGLRGEPGFADGYRTILLGAGRGNPVAVARLIQSATVPREALDVASSVAGYWAQQDAPAAAQWVGGWLTDQGDAAVVSSAVRSVAMAWARTDSAAARAWVIGMPDGAARDSGLAAYLSVSAGASGTLDSALLASFSSDAARQRAASGAIVQIGRANPAEARRLLDMHISDAEIRRRAEENLARTGGSGSATISLPF